MSATPSGAVFTLRSDEIEANWDHFAHHLERFEQETGEISTQQLRCDLTDARKQFWGYHDGERISLVCITEIQLPLCWLWACCGTETSPGQIEAGLEAIRQWAVELGCSRLKIRGRLGWERRLTGFKRVGIILEKHL